MAISKIIYQDSDTGMVEAMRRNGESLVTLLELER